MKNVNLDGNVLKDDSVANISTCLHNIEELNLPRCQLTARGTEILSDAIKRLHVPVRGILWLLRSAASNFDN